MLDQAFFAQVEHFLRRIRDLEQGGGGLVHPGISCLRRKGHGDNQRIGVHVIQLALRLGFGRVETGKDLADRVVAELFCHRGL